jgi:gamma-glutamylcyclotransferase (GGCT)/AIG2-like uncharacterized protein YtfP
MLYMAYGMNTNRDAMSVRCPKAKPLGGFYLPDTRLVFRGVADIVPDTETICPVVLWEITLDCLRSLDQLEGYPHLYNRRKINTDWIVYEMNDKTRNRPPNGGYYKMIEDGYKDFGLDDYKLRVALAEAEEMAA